LGKIARRAEADPEQREEMYTLAAEAMLENAGVPKSQQVKRVLLFDGGYVEKAEGGLADAAEAVRGAGRGKDEVLLHVSPGEYDTLVEMWGEPSMNPETGIPEYGLKKWLKKGKKALKKIVKSKAFQVIAPIALATFGGPLGAALGAKLGVGPVVGNALIRGGLGAVTGGKKGALKGLAAGAVAGGAGTKLGEALKFSGKTADVIGSALIKGGGSSLAGEGFGRGAIGGGLEAYAEMRPEQIGERLREQFGITTGVSMPDLATAIPGGRAALGPGAAGPPAAALAADPVAAPPAAGGTDFAGGLGELEKLAKKYAIPALLGAGIVGGQGEYEEAEAPQLPESFQQSLPRYNLERRFNPMDPSSYYTYGQAGSPMSGEHLFIDPPGPFPFEEEQQGMPPPGGLGQAAGGYQRGGEFDYWEQNQEIFDSVPTVSARGRYVRGGGSGRSDDIEARLSDGEYVIDAESVALLGDGSGEHGAKRLDEMRSNLRKHKGKNLKKGKFSHKAKKPVNYMSKMGRLRRSAKYEHGGVMNVAGTSPPHMGATGVNV
jgi:hypothetical protein